MGRLEIPENGYRPFSWCGGPVFDIKGAFIRCRPYSISNILAVKPAFVPCDKMPPIIVRVYAEFAK
jgi:hypothetical protein